jgi:hypothetical protein
MTGRGPRESGGRDTDGGTEGGRRAKFLGYKVEVRRNIDVMRNKWRAWKVRNAGARIGWRVRSHIAQKRLAAST